MNKFAFYKKIIEQKKDEYLGLEHAKAGHNGPYNMRETPIRNTAHWIVSFSIMYKITREEDYKKIIEKFSQYLLDAVQNSKNGAVRCMYEDGFSSTNCLIGQAWAIEGLVSAYDILRWEKLLDAAERIFFSQEYDDKVHSWDMIDVDGYNLGKDIAFNHILWFAMAGGKIVQRRVNEEIERQVVDCINCIESHILVYKNGLISHFAVQNESLVRDLKTKIKKYICEFTGKGIPGRKNNWVEYERAYHLYSIYAIALIYQLYPQSKLFKSNKFQRIKEYGLKTDNFKRFNEKKDYAYFYNSPAFEYPVVAYVFNALDREVKEEELFEIHINSTYNKMSNDFSKDAVDTETLNARIYEIMQYYDLLIQKGEFAYE